MWALVGMCRAAVAADQTIDGEQAMTLTVSRSVVHGTCGCGARMDGPAFTFTLPGCGSVAYCDRCAPTALLEFTRRAFARNLQTHLIRDGQQNLLAAAEIITVDLSGLAAN